MTLELFKTILELCWALLVGYPTIVTGLRAGGFIPGTDMLTRWEGPLASPYGSSPAPLILICVELGAATGLI